MDGGSGQDSQLDEPDSLLVERSRRGDRMAFTVLVVRYRELALSAAWRMTGDAAAADDVAQEAFLKALNRIGSFRGEATFKTWLLRIIVNSASNYRRSRRREVPVDPATLHNRATARSPTDSTMNRELTEVVQAALAALPPHYRSAIVLREYEDCSYQEIAQILKIPVGTVMSRLATARDLLRVRLSPYCKEHRA